MALLSGSRHERECVFKIFGNVRRARDTKQAGELRPAHILAKISVVSTDTSASSGDRPTSTQRSHRRSASALLEIERAEHRARARASRARAADGQRRAAPAARGASAASTPAAPRPLRMSSTIDDLEIAAQRHLAAVAQRDTAGARSRECSPIDAWRASPVSSSRTRGGRAPMRIDERERPAGRRTATAPAPSTTTVECAAVPRKRSRSTMSAA